MYVIISSVGGLNLAKVGEIKWSMSPKMSLMNLIYDYNYEGLDLK